MSNAKSAASSAGSSGPDAGAFLVATDGSGSAQHAAGLAIRLAAGQGRPVRGLYVVDEALVMDTYGRHEAELGTTRRFSSRSDLIAYLQRRGTAALQWLELQCEAAKVPVSVDLLMGNVAELVRRQATEAGLLALGRRGHGHADDPQHLGHHFIAVAHRVNLPLLVGSSGSPPIQRLLLVCRDDHGDRRAAAWTARLQEGLAAVVSVLAPPGQDAALRTELEAKGLAQFRMVPGSALTSEDIGVAASRCRADLLIVSNHRRSLLPGWLAGHPIDDLLRTTALPVLIA
jgi:nucleotide-binding universal stress UspA family protein